MKAVKERDVRLDEVILPYGSHLDTSQKVDDRWMVLYC